MTKINTQDLTDQALDWAVATALGHVVNGDAATHGYTQWRTQENVILCCPFNPSVGCDFLKLVRDHNIALIPPTNRVHRHGGGSQPGWGLSGIWSATTFHAGWGGARASAWHETDPAIAAMRCLVAHYLGPAIEIPQEFRS